MKLNPDCIRDILLLTEERESIMSPNNYPELNKYSREEISYHAKQCNNAELFERYRQYVDGGFSIVDLSAKGHEGLAKIRSDNAWSKIKSGLRSVVISSVTSLIDGILSGMFN